MSSLKRQELDRNPAFQMWRATNAWQRVVRRALSEVGVTHVQFVLLASADILSLEGKAVTQRHICRFADVDENMTSQVMKSLIDKGYVARKPHPDDARAWQIEMTHAGRDLLANARAALKPAKESFFAPLDGREDELTDLLRKLAGNAEEFPFH